MSFDDPATNLEWAQEEGFPFELWTDNDDRTLALTYRAVTNAAAPYAGRITVILDSEGSLVLQYLDSINVGTHPALVYDDCVILMEDGLLP